MRVAVGFVKIEPNLNFNWFEANSKQGIIVAPPVKYNCIVNVGVCSSLIVEMSKIS